MAPLFSSSGHPLSTPDNVEQQGVETPPRSLHSGISAPANASLSCSDTLFSLAASPVPSSRASPPRLLPAPSASGSSPPSPSPERAPAQSHITPQPPHPCLSLPLSPELAHAQSRATTLPHHVSPLSSPRPSNAPASALCDPTPLPPPVRQTRKRSNAGPLATEPKSKKSKGTGSTSGGALSTRNSPTVAKLSKGCHPHNSAVAGVTPMTSKNRSSSEVPDWFSRSLQMLQSHQEKGGWL